MKRWMICMLFVCMGSAALMQAQERDAAQTEEENADELLYEAALQAMEEKAFVFEADQALFNNGMTAFLYSNTNFIMEEGEKSTVQVAFDTTLSGPNGIGGVTVDGNTTNFRLKVNKKGKVTCSFSSSGIAISAQISITMSKGSNRAVAVITPNFNNRKLTLRGNVVPLEASSVYKARSL